MIKHEIVASNLGRSVLLLALPHQSECTRSLLLVPRENKGYVLLVLFFVKACSSKHWDIMRRTFVSRSRRYVPLMGRSKTLSTYAADCKSLYCEPHSLSALSSQPVPVLVVSFIGFVVLPFVC